MQTNATIPTRWSVLGVPPPPDIYFICLVVHIECHGTLVQVSNFIMLEKGNYWL